MIILKPKPYFTWRWFYAWGCRFQPYYRHISKQFLGSTFCQFVRCWTPASTCCVEETKYVFVSVRLSRLENLLLERKIKHGLLLYSSPWKDGETPVLKVTRFVKIIFSYNPSIWTPSLVYQFFKSFAPIRLFASREPESRTNFLASS